MKNIKGKRYYIFLVIVTGVFYFIGSIQSDLIRILIGAPFALLGVYSLNKLLNLPKNHEKTLIQGSFLWILIIVALLLVAVIIRSVF